MAAPERGAERRRRWREGVALARARLATSQGARFGGVVSWILLVAYAGGAVAQRFTEAAPADVLGYGPEAARTAAWLAAGPIALAAAHARERRDEAEGVAALAAGFGIARSALRGARLIAVLVACARVIAVPALGTALVACALQPGLREAASALRVVPALAVFSVVAGVALGVAATVADRLSPDRGRSALAAIVLVPWIVADAAGWSGASIPGALDAVLDSALATLGLGRLA